MKRYLLIGALLIGAGLVYADHSGSEISKNIGDTINTQSITSNTSSASVLIDETNDLSKKSAEIDIFNNSAYTLWIGSNTTSLQTTGFPIQSSATYTTDGSYRGSLYGMTDSSAGGNTNVRVIYYLRSDALVQ